MHNLQSLELATYHTSVQVSSICENMVEFFWLNLEEPFKVEEER